MSELVEGTRLDIVSTATAVSGVRIPRSPPSEYIWPVGQVVKTPPFHGGNTGSNPVRVIFDLGGLAQLGERLPYKQEVVGSIPASSTIRQCAKIHELSKIQHIVSLFRSRGGAVW